MKEFIVVGIGFKFLTRVLAPHAQSALRKATGVSGVPVVGTTQDYRTPGNKVYMVKVARHPTLPVW